MAPEEGKHVGCNSWAVMIGANHIIKGTGNMVEKDNVVWMSMVKC